MNAIYVGTRVFALKFYVMAFVDVAAPKGRI